MTFLTKTGSYYVLSFAAALSMAAEASELNVDLGVTALGQQHHIVGEDDKTELHPYLNLQYGMFVAGPDGVGITTSVGQRDQFSALVSVRESVLDGVNSKLDKVNERKDAAEFALYWTHMSQNIDVTAAVAVDASDTHNGYEAKLIFSKLLETNAGSFVPALAILHQSDKLVDYYYGVTPLESGTGYAAYTGEASTNANLSLTHIYPITQHWHLTTLVAYEHLGEGIQDSSIVERSGYWSGAMTMLYRF
ncbi:hypothetical protein DN730_14470 [Marinomonas piezotolerans]|uniref:MipA/OmpV family protein n=1 Tax=Marinomonas piezotolerans TaxID=2213058 RepID=A0A370U6Z5_9GAMM|nr:MipA/OmpV family protein [Marinomonas piezotolerans]RDL43535.1 hypothetical protein DN730_14470 [Marinomonas piezotolerans]